VNNKYLYWGLLLAINWLLLLPLVGRILSPFACLFIWRAALTDTVKRLDKRVVMLNRDNLVLWLSWFATDDNNVDEYWYGMYGNTSNVTQEYYDTHAIYRWWCRVLWLQRNNLYTFNRKFFGLPKDSPLAWQYKAKWPLLFGWYNDVNIGFKAHKGIDRLMFAGRFLGLRKG
jgi:hypothetical protein